MDEERNATVINIIKKKKVHGGGHGGAWKVAYADFVTAMMSLFIVLWIVGQSSHIKDAIAAYFKDPGVFSSSRSGGVLPDGQKAAPPPVPLDKLQEEMTKLQAEAGNIEKSIAAIPDFSKIKDKIQVTVTPEGLRIDLVEDSEGLFFDIGKATIKPMTVLLLKVIASHLGTLENKVVLEGYTDARPYSSAGYSNWDLSSDRANSARKVLEESGLQKDQLREVRGFADRKLKLPDKPYDYANRRVSILVVPNESAHPAPGAPAQAAVVDPGKTAQTGSAPPGKATQAGAVDPGKSAQAGGARPDSGKPAQAPAAPSGFDRPVHGGVPLSALTPMK